MISPPTIDQEFRRVFGAAPTLTVTAPGRVNLIGEHTDYNDGYVFPVAIDRYVRIAAGPGTDNTVSIYSTLLNASAEFPLSQLRPNKQAPWTNYVCGVIHLLLRKGITLGGLNLVIESTIPVAAGLSSSAALEVATAYAVQALYPFDMPQLELIKLCQQAEYSFVGVHCGIMDQFVITLGKKDAALLIDCRSLEYKAVPIPPALKLIICNTNVPRTLLNSEYNLRRVDCQMAAHKLSARLSNVTALRDVSIGDLRKNKLALDGTVYRRAHHVVTENLRVLDSVDSLRSGDYNDFGIQMYKSHFSLRYDFQVSCKELDAVVDICSTLPGVMGARMTGAGFGGCAVCVAQADAVDSVIAALETEYPRRTGLKPSIFSSTLEAGVAVERHG